MNDGKANEKHYCIYLRKSREEEEAEKYGDGMTLERHEAMLQRFCREKGIHAERVYRELVSGEMLTERPEACEMLRLINDSAYWDGIVVVDVKRLTRGDSRDQDTIVEILRQAGTRIITPSGSFDPRNPSDNQSLRMSMFMANMNWEAIREGYRRGVRNSLEDGQYIGRFAPFGYDKVKVGRKKTLKPNGDAKYVRQMFEWAAEDDLSYFSIAKRLTNMGVPPIRGGSEWMPTSVANILKNETYYGMIRWDQHKTRREFVGDSFEKRKTVKLNDDYTLYKGMHEPLVDESVFMKARENAAKRLPVNSGKQTANALAGLVRCAKCGRAMQYLYDKRRNESRIAHKSSQMCHCKGMLFDPLVDMLVDALTQSLREMEFMLEDDAAEKAEAQHRMAMETLQGEIALIEKSGTDLFDRLDRGVIDEEDFVARRAVLKKRKAILLEKLEAEKANAPSRPNIQARMASTREAISLLRDEGASADDKNRFLKSFVDHIDYANESGYGKNDRVHLAIHFRDQC